MSKRMYKGFTLAELAVAIVIIGIVAAVIFPIFARSGGRCGGRISCVSNMKNIGLALAMYTVDYDGALIKEYYGILDKTARRRQPTDIQSYSWRWAIQPYLKNVNVLACPSNPVANNPELWTNSVTYANGSNGQWVPGGYATNENIIGFANAPATGPISTRLSLDSQIKDPANTIIVADTRYVWNDVGIDWIAGNMTRPGLPPGSAYHGGLTPCGVTAGVPSNTPDHCAYDNKGTFQLDQGFVNFIFADSHVRPLKLASTAIPNDMWNSGYTLSERTALVQNMLTEYH